MSSRVPREISAGFPLGISPEIIFRCSFRLFSGIPTRFFSRGLLLINLETHLGIFSGTSSDFFGSLHEWFLRFSNDFFLKFHSGLLPDFLPECLHRLLPGLFRDSLIDASDVSSQKNPLVISSSIRPINLPGVSLLFPLVICSGIFPEILLLVLIGIPTGFLSEFPLVISTGIHSKIAHRIHPRINPFFSGGFLARL